MNTNDLNTALYEKMTAEQDNYRDWLKSPVSYTHLILLKSVRFQLLYLMQRILDANGVLW